MLYIYENYDEYYSKDYYSSSAYFKTMSDLHLNNAINQAGQRIDWWSVKLNTLMRELNSRNQNALKKMVIKKKIVKSRVKTGQRKK